MEAPLDRTPQRKCFSEGTMSHATMRGIVSASNELACAIQACLGLCAPETPQRKDVSNYEKKKLQSGNLF